MAGRLDETHYHEVKRTHQSDQCNLGQFTDEQTTLIAVVSSPRRNIDRYVDEVWPELGMPGWALKKFLAKRSGYRSNSAVDDAHNKAYDDLDLGSIYYNHLQDSEEAQERIQEAVERVASGENLTLVCYETKGEQCHRHMLLDIISDGVESRTACRFELSA